MIVPWGCRAGTLPRSGYTWRTTVEAGQWTVYGAEEVVIPATAGTRNGIRFPIRQGIRGLIAAAGVTAAYMLVGPSTYYFKIMTKSEQMPVLIGERI